MQLPKLKILPKYLFLKFLNMPKIPIRRQVALLLNLPLQLLMYVLHPIPISNPLLNKQPLQKLHKNTLSIIDLDGLSQGLQLVVNLIGLFVVGTRVRGLAGLLEGLVGQDALAGVVFALGHLALTTFVFWGGGQGWHHVAA